MNVTDFRQMYVTEIQELRSVEAQLVDALPKMAEVANHPELKQAIQSHLEETRSQRIKETIEKLQKEWKNPRNL